MMTGASGAAYGDIAAEAADSGEKPLWFLAATVQVYDFANPSTYTGIGFARDVEVRVGPPFDDVQVARYVEIAELPTTDGAVYETRAVVPPDRAADTAVGAPGAPAIVVVGARDVVTPALVVVGAAVVEVIVPSGV